MHRLKSPGWEAQCEGTDADPFRLNTGRVSLFLHGFPGRWLLEPHHSTQRMGSPLLLQAPGEQGFSRGTIGHIRFPRGTLQFEKQPIAGSGSMFVEWLLYADADIQCPGE